MRNLRYILLPATLLALAVSSCRRGSEGAGTQSGPEAVRPSAVPATVAARPAAAAADTTDIPDPKIELLSKGSILPSGEGMDLLFGSESYSKARIRVRKIYPSNVLQYLQSGENDLVYGIESVSNIVTDTVIVLGAPGAAHLRNYKTYALGLDELIRREKGALYRVEIRGLDPLTTAESGWESDTYFGDYATYARRHTDLLASDICLTAKQGDNGLEVFAFNIMTARPVSSVSVKVYDYAQQELAKGRTGSDGQIMFKGLEGGSFITAVSGSDYAYMRISPEKSLNLGGFDTSGAENNRGIKAYLFGERGVWRPGDRIHLGLITMAEPDMLPDGLPIVAELLNPDGNSVQSLSARTDSRHLYHFEFSTPADARTGRWLARVSIGGQVFTRGLRIETVKPNKLDIRLSYDEDILGTGGKGAADVDVNWLYGAAGSGLAVEGEVRLSPKATTFRGYGDYCFSDPSQTFEPQELSYARSVTDSRGRTRISTAFSIAKGSAPGMLRADFTIRAYEPSGEFSTTGDSRDYSPYGTYIGIRTKADKRPWGSEYLRHGTQHRFELVALSPDGRLREAPVNLKVEVHHINASWWWNAEGAVADYKAGTSRSIVYSTDLVTRKGRADFSYDWKDSPEGLTYIRVSDPDGGHGTALIFEVSDDSTEAGDEAETPTKLVISKDKEKYAAGEKARISFPSPSGASAIVSLEKGGRLLSSRIVSCKGGSTSVDIPVTADMMPNTYVFVSLIQPHGSVDNDAPVRLYGVCSLPVESPDSRLHPVVEAPETVRPESTLSLKVRESGRRRMSYVIAVVDEGLLSLTPFKTPDAWDKFYSKEALRVRTWDAYDRIIGAYGGKIEQLYSIGGDDEYRGAVKAPGAERFKPVVEYLGPFDLKAGATATHEVHLPQYIGSLRVMVIATDGRAQGSTQRNVNVSKPLMVQASLPRILGTGETIRIPVTLLALKDGVGKVRLGISADGPVEIEGESSLNVSIPKEGQQIEYFTIRTAGGTGTAHIRVRAESSSDSSESVTEIDVRNPNPRSTRLKSIILKPGETAELSAGAFGEDGTNTAVLELSSMPAINLDSRMNYLLRYPYGCLEQTISTAFPQLYLPAMQEMDKSTALRLSRNVEGAISRMQNYRTAGGGLSYWPGTGNASEFGSSYALHFLTEAEKAGYAVPSELRSSLVRYLSSAVRKDKRKDFTSAYALYALALSGQAMRPEMNNMREHPGGVGRSAQWMLAAAYAADGKYSVAGKLISGLPYIESKGGSYGSYGSRERNMAVALKLCKILGLRQEAFELASKIAAELNDPSAYMSTQATAWCLSAMADYGASEGKGISADISGDRIASGSTLVSRELPVSEDKVAVNIRNSGSSELYATLSLSGIARADQEKALSSGLAMSVRYFSQESNSPVDVSRLRRGELFCAEVTVTNTGAETVNDIALSQVFPSGWEIRNERLYRSAFSYPSGVDYQDFRDDRVYSFFDLAPGASVKVTVRLTATYPGTFRLPAVSCEAMYDHSRSALIPGQDVIVE